jgi:5'-nucleotidase (lipoprotein e(P4) family)
VKEQPIFHWTRSGELRATALSLTLVVFGCGSHAPPHPPAASTALSVPESIRWVQRSAEHTAAFVQTYRLAAQYVEQQAAGRQSGSWGVVLDADETILDNSQYQIERFRAGLGFTQESWTAWVRRREATPLPGAARFLSRVRELGGAVAVVTNRLQSECDDTIAVFRTHQLAFDAMLCRPDGTPSDKNPRFKAVAAGLKETGGRPLEILAFVGDNIVDFPSLTQAVRESGEAGFGDFGARYFILPNPMYGSWQ